MAHIWYGHFDSIQDDERELLAEDWARFIRAFLGDGIKNGGTNLAVTEAPTGMKVLLDLGVAHIQGYIFECVEDITTGRYYEINVESAHPSLNRIDRLVLRLDRTIKTRTIEPVVLLGEASVNPVPPQLTRNANIWEISLAQIKVHAGAINIREDSIIDERLNSSVCGLIDSLITADTEGMFYDFQAAFAGRMLDLTQEFYHWFDDFRDTSVSEFQAFFDAQKLKAAEIWDWYGTVKVEIAKLQTFDFDNLAELPGVVRFTVINPDRSITETIRMSFSDLPVATRETVRAGDGSIVVRQTVYAEDGESVFKSSVITTTRQPDGSIKEVVE